MNNILSSQRLPIHHAIHWSIFSVILIILIIFILFYTKKYLKEKKQILNLKKTIILSMFFSIFIVQSLLTKFLGHLPIIPINFDILTIIAVGFIFGPLEGIIYGFAADITRVLINGWAIELLPLLIYPSVALISGIMGRIYIKNKDNSKNSFILFQSSILFFIFTSILSIVFSNNSSEISYDDSFYYAAIAASCVSVVSIELFYYFYIRNKKQESKLLSMILLIIILERTLFGFGVRSFSQFYYYGYPFGTQVLTRLITASYLVPLWTIFSFTIIKVSFFSLENH